MNEHQQSHINFGICFSRFFCKQNLTPTFSWDGLIEISTKPKDPKKITCPKSNSLAFTIEDLDYPNGMGESGNSVFLHYWAVDIPGDWTSFDASKTGLIKNGSNLKLVHEGMTSPDRVKSDGSGLLDTSMVPICPKKGIHRYRFTLYALKGELSTGDSRLAEDAPFGSVAGALDGNKLAKFVSFAKIAGNPMNVVA